MYWTTAKRSRKVTLTKYGAIRASSKLTSAKQRGLPMLEIREVHVYYGAIHALKGVSLTVERGELVTLIGAKAAGKTTPIQTLSGVVRPKRAAALLEGQTLQRAQA